MNAMIWRLYTGLLVLLTLGGSSRAITIGVPESDSSILYMTNPNGGNTTWAEVPASSDSCSTAQKVTSRIGDQMNFTFTGTGIGLIGTQGIRGGLISIMLDGHFLTNYSRQSNDQLVCGSLIFDLEGISFEQHTLIVSLAGNEINPSTGQLDGILSIQELFYTIPGDEHKKIDIAPIISVLIAVIFLSVAADLAFFFWRQRHPKRRNVDVGGDKEASRTWSGFLEKIPLKKVRTRQPEQQQQGGQLQQGLLEGI